MRTTPSRELDAAVAAALGIEHAPYSSHQGALLQVFEALAIHVALRGGVHISLHRYLDGTWSVVRDAEGPLVMDDCDDGTVIGEGPTAPLAVCDAALRKEWRE